MNEKCKNLDRHIDIKHNYNSVDLFKFICSYIIITIHCSPFLVFGEQIDLAIVSTFSRIAVPFFFVCSGFFFLKNLEYNNGKIVNCKSNRAKLYKYVGRIFLLYFIWSLIYLVIQIPEWYSTGWLSINAFKDYFIALFRSSSYYHLWYLLDIIYATIIGFIALSIIKRKYFYLLVSILYFIGMLHYSYFWIDVPLVNFIDKISTLFPAMWDSATRALPIMSIGLYIALDNKGRIKKVNLFLFLTSFALLIGEFLLLNNLTNNHSNFSYIIMTIPCAYFLFVWIANRNINISKQNSVLLRNMSTVIYCIHPLFIYLFSMNKDFDNLNSILKYLVVVFSATLVSFVFVKLSKYNYMKFLKYLY